jgi:hypothetical protein
MDTAAIARLNACTYASGPSHRVVVYPIPIPHTPFWLPYGLLGFVEPTTATVWARQVMYVHQQRVSYPGTPLQLFERVQQFASQKSRRSQHGPGQHGPGSEADLGQLVEHMGLDQSVLSQPWSQLSVSGPNQRQHVLALAVRGKAGAKTCVYGEQQQHSSR